MNIDDVVRTFGQDRVIKIAKQSCRRHPASPPSLHAAITDHCFNRCVTCWHWRRSNKQQIDPIRFMAAMSRMPDTRTVCFTGGDPFAHTDLHQILGYCLENGVSYGLVTAGALPVSKSTSKSREWLLKVGIPAARWLRISLDAPDEESYARVRGGMPFRLVLASIKELIGTGVDVQFGITLSRMNEDKIDSLMELITQLWMLPDANVTRVDVRSVYSSVEDIRESRAFHPNPDWLPKSVQLNIDVPRTTPIEFKHCYAAGQYQLFMDATGDFYPCCVLGGDTGSSPLIQPLGNINYVGEAMRMAAIFSKLTPNELPNVCRIDCPRRLNAINVACYELRQCKDFY